MLSVQKEDFKATILLYLASLRSMDFGHVPPVNEIQYTHEAEFERPRSWVVTTSFQHYIIGSCEELMVKENFYVLMRWINLVSCLGKSMSLRRSLLSGLRSWIMFRYSIIG